MIARKNLPSEYEEFNRVHHAPFGHRLAPRLHRLGERNPFRVRLAGPYAWQTNSTTRTFEYPWAFEQITQLGSGLVIADVGASLSGFQYTLAQAGYKVHAVDPGMAATGRGWALDPAFHQHLASVYKAPVTLHPSPLESAGLAEHSVDIVLSVSTIEHFGPGDLANFAASARRVLKPGGWLVFTLDLFLDLVPFTDRERNDYGINVNVADLLTQIGAKLVFGDESEIYGFPSFDARSIQAQLSKFFIGTYPVVAQCLVAQLE